MKRTELFFGTLRVPVDLLAIVAAFFAARALRLTDTPLTHWLASPADIAPEFGQLLPFAGLAALALVVIFAMNGLYRLRRPIGVGEETKHIVFLTSAWVMALTAYFFLTHEQSFSRLVLAYAWVLTAAFVVALRLTLRFAERIAFRFFDTPLRVVIVGRGLDADAISEALSRRPRHIVVGSFSPERLTEPDAFAAFLRETQAEEIIALHAEMTSADVRHILDLARAEHIALYVVPDLLDAATGNVDITTLAGMPLMHFRASPLDGWGRVTKRAFDLIVGTLAIIGTSPIWLATAIAIRFDSPGPIFFSTYPSGEKVLRVGRGGALFHFVKFRSMVVNDHTSRYAMPSHRAGPLVKITHDPRITHVGAIIRKYSIDELPNLLAVVKGDMSLVGPRAHLPEEVEKYAPHHRRVLTIKPGITGLPQVSGRSDLDFEKEVELDTWYIENWSVWLDVKILWKTVAVVLFPNHRE